jgi:hypothetical protein
LKREETQVGWLMGLEPTTTGITIRATDRTYVSDFSQVCSSDFRNMRLRNTSGSA